MGLAELLLLAIGLSMDAFAVSVCKGLAIGAECKEEAAEPQAEFPPKAGRKINTRQALICGVWFGGFQALMPMIGYFLGAAFENVISAISGTVAFALLVLIGGNMIREALSKDEDKTSGSTDFKTMLLMAVATSIDALAVGITLACVPVCLFDGSRLGNTVCSVLIIGMTTFAISFAGVKFGSYFGKKFEAKAEIAGGVILILIGVKILLEYLLK